MDNFKKNFPDLYAELQYVIQKKYIEHQTETAMIKFLLIANGLMDAILVCFRLPNFKGTLLSKLELLRTFLDYNSERTPILDEESIYEKLDYIRKKATESMDGIEPFKEDAYTCQNYLFDIISWVSNQTSVEQVHSRRNNDEFLTKMSS